MGAKILLRGCRDLIDVVVIGVANENVVHISVTNTSLQTRSLGNDSKIAYSHTNFSEVDTEDDEIRDTINVITADVSKLLCDPKNFTHLSEEQYSQVKSLLMEFNDIFTKSNETIGRSKMTSPLAFNLCSFFKR